MAFLYLTRIIAMPVTVSGRDIVDSRGATIATAAEPFAAYAMAQLINMGQPAAQEAERQHEEREDRVARWFAASRKRSDAPATR